jgi:UDP-3-O-[3-hydroxymyristoyl] glucosamine N-acyltransferase
VTHTRAGLAALLEGALEGPDGPVTALRDPADAGMDDAVVARYAKYLPSCLESPANLVVIDQKTVLDATSRSRAGRSFLRVPDLEIAWERLLTAFSPTLEREPGVHPSAQVDPTARLGEGVHVGPNAVISRNVRVGDGCVILGGALIGEGSSLGQDCLIHPNASVLHRVTLGDRVVVQSGAVVGSDGFGFRRTDEHHHVRLPHIGTVTLEDDVEVGANSVVDRGTLGETRVGARTKIGPACIVAHNAMIGQDVLLIGAVQLAGSITIHDRAVLWGQVGAVGHITIGADATVTAQSGVSKSLPAGGTYRGSPAQPVREFARLEARTRDLERMAQRIKALEERLEDRSTDANERGNAKMKAHIEPSRGKHST